MGSPGPVSGGSGPQRTLWDNGFINAIKTTLNKVAEFMGDVALTLRLPLVGPWVSDYRARREFIAQLPDGMVEDQAKTADKAQQLVDRTHPFGEPVESSQKAPAARLTMKEELEKTIKTLEQKIDDLHTKIDQNKKSMDDNLKLEGTDKAIPGLNTKLGSENFGLELQIEALEDEITNLQILDPDIQLKSMEKLISELVDVNELQTLLRNIQTEKWPNREHILNSVTKAIENRINEIKRDNNAAS